MTPVSVLVKRIVQALVDDEQAVQVDEENIEQGLRLNIRVDPQDTGKLIGRQGRTAQSLRILLVGIGMKAKSYYSLNIQE